MKNNIWLLNKNLPVWKEENQNSGFFCIISFSQKCAGNIMLFLGFISSDAKGDFF